MFAETSSEVQVGAAYEPSCTIEMPSVVVLNVHQTDQYGLSNKTLSTDGILRNGLFSSGGISGNINCSKKLIARINIDVDNSNGKYTGVVYNYPRMKDRSGIFPITNTPDASDDGVYSVGLMPWNIRYKGVLIEHYIDNQYEGILEGSGLPEDTLIWMVASSHNCPTAIGYQGGEYGNCPAGDVTGSAVISLSW